MIPSTPSSPGATAAGAADCIERQLRGAWGTGASPLRSSAWQAGSPIPRRPTPLTPALYFETAVHALERNLGSSGAFCRLPEPEQRRYLHDLRATPIDLGGIPSDDFFETLLVLTVEAYFSHPNLATTRDRIEWPLPNFAGGHSLLPRQVG